MCVIIVRYSFLVGQKCVADGVNGFSPSSLSNGIRIILHRHSKRLSSNTDRWVTLSFRENICKFNLAQRKSRQGRGVVSPISVIIDELKRKLTIKILILRSFPPSSCLRSGNEIVFTVWDDSNFSSSRQTQRKIDYNREDECRQKCRHRFERTSAVGTVPIA